MPRIKLSQRFMESYIHLPVDIRKKVDKAILLLQENPRHPSLQSKPIQGAEGIYEARIDLNYRLTYEREPDDTIRLRVVGRHDEALKRP